MTMSMTPIFDTSLEVIAGTDIRWCQLLWLDKWKIHVVPTQDQMIELMGLVPVLQWVHINTGKPIIVTSGLRPPLYNELIGGASKSAHQYGRAIDFMVDGMKSSDVRVILEPKLEGFGIRMERETVHVHIDSMPVIHERYFKA